LYFFASLTGIGPLQLKKDPDIMSLKGEFHFNESGRIRSVDNDRKEPDVAK